MDVTLQKSSLIAALEHAARVAPARPTIPILGNALLRASALGVPGAADSLSLLATDTEIAYSGRVLATVESPGDAAVSPGGLLKRCKALPGDTVRLQSRGRIGSALAVSAGRVTFTVPSADPTDFPPTPALDPRGTLQIVAADLARVIGHAAVAVCTNEARYGLRGMLVESFDESFNASAGEGRGRGDGGAGGAGGVRRILRCVGTDGHALVLSAAPCSGTYALPRVPSPGCAILPRAATSVLRAWLEPLGKEAVEISFGEGAISVRLADPGRGSLWVRLLDDEFPDFNGFLPAAKADHKSKIRVDRAVLLALLKRASLVSRSSIALALDVTRTEIAASLQSASGGGLEETVPADLTGEPIRVGLDPGILSTVLAAVDGPPTLSIDHPLGPCTVRGDDPGVFALVMPMRLN